jgi:translation elongation factor EF-1beta
MKKQFLILSLALAFCLQLAAQTYKIDTAKITFENGERPCYKVKYDASPKTVKKAWDDYFKKNYDVKVKGIGFLTNKEVITATDITLVAVSEKRMNMYAAVVDAPGDRSELSYFMSFGYDFFIGPENYPTEFTAMKKLLNDFSVAFLTDFYYSEASRMTSEIKGLEKDIRKNNKDIKKNTKKARKESKEVASGLSAKNTSMQMENDQAKLKIEQLAKDIENIKVKQAGITRN